MSMKCFLKTIIDIHLHLPILQLQTFMFKVDQADMYPWQIIISNMAYPTTHNWFNIILLINTCTKLAYWGGALRDDRMRKAGERLPWDPEDIFF